MAKRRETRADLIAALKSRGIKGKLSKMKLAQLRELAAQSAPPEAHEEDTAHGQRDDMRQSGGLRLAPDPQAKQDGGHSYRKDGTTTAKEDAKYKHTHRKKTWPAQEGKGHSYRSFVAAKLKEGKTMKAAAAEWKEQKGGHNVKKDGTVSAVEAAKYKHTHAGENPATDSARAPVSATAKAGSKDEAKKARAERAAAAVKAAAAPKAAAPSPRKAATKKKVATKRASADQSIFDGPAASPKAKPKSPKRSSNRTKPASQETQARASAVTETQMQKARARLERNAYSDTHLGRFQKFRDEMGVRNKKYPTQSAASAEYQSRKRADARLEQEMAETRLERENTEATDAMDRQRREDRVADMPSIPRREQDGDGYRQEGHGHGDHVDGQDGGKFTAGDAAGLAGMAALALFAPGVGSVADAGLLATMEAGDAANTANEAYQAAMDARVGLEADGASAGDIAGARANTAAAKEQLEAATEKQQAELAARRKLLKFPDKVRSLGSATQEANFIEHGIPVRGFVGEHGLSIFGGDGSVGEALASYNPMTASEGGLLQAQVRANVVLPAALGFAKAADTLISKDVRDLTPGAFTGDDGGGDGDGGDGDGGNTGGPSGPGRGPGAPSGGPPAPPSAGMPPMPPTRGGDRIPGSGQPWY